MNKVLLFLSIVCCLQVHVSDNEQPLLSHACFEVASRNDSDLGSDIESRRVQSSEVVQAEVVSVPQLVTLACYSDPQKLREEGNFLHKDRSIGSYVRKVFGKEEQMFLGSQWLVIRNLDELRFRFHTVSRVEDQSQVRHNFTLEFDEDGSKVYTYPDGVVRKYCMNGTKVTIFSNGEVIASDKTGDLLYRMKPKKKLPKVLSETDL